MRSSLINTMMESSTDHVSVAAVMLKQKSQHAWGNDFWILKGLVPGYSSPELATLESQGEVHIWPDLTLQLYPLHCDSYYHNLTSEQPKVYLVASQDDETLSPLLITVDYDEAASYMETGEQVFNAPLSEQLCQWLEAFVLEHYKPEQPKKRRRKQWHGSEQKHGR